MDWFLYDNGIRHKRVNSFQVALFSCWNFFVLHLFSVHFLHVARFLGWTFSVALSSHLPLLPPLFMFCSCCIIFMFHFFLVTLFCVVRSSCYIVFMLHLFHIALFSCFAISMLHSFRVGFFSCYTFFMLLFFRVVPFSFCSFSLLHYFHVTFCVAFFFMFLKTLLTNTF